jgi:hypothetical protein
MGDFMSKLFFVIIVFAAFSLTFAETPANLQTLHRNGQTFLTWDDVGGATAYRIYRSTSALTTPDLTSANMVAEISSNSSYIEHWADLKGRTLKNAMGSGYFRIIDLGPPLASSKELFVWTTQESGGGDFYYAVTAVTGTAEDATVGGGNAAGPIQEDECTVICPVEQAQTTDKSGHIFMFWMPYDKWNPGNEGYAYPVYIAAKEELKTTTSKVECMVHGLGGVHGPWTRCLFPMDKRLHTHLPAVLQL